MKTTVKFILFVPAAITIAAFAWYYYYHSGKNVEKRLSNKEVANLFAVLNRLTLWRKILNQNRFAEQQRKILAGTNINLDLIVPFDEFIKGYDTRNKIDPSSSEVISSLDQFFATFSFYMSRGAAAERFVTDKQLFENLTAVAQRGVHRLHIGGNAALIAEFLSRFPHIDIRLFGPVGNKLRPLMSQRLFEDLVEEQSDKPDEIHLIIEYKAGQNLSTLKAPLANRFIVHHDISNSQAVHVKGFLDAVTSSDQPLDWAVWSGLHFLESLEPNEYMPRIKEFRSSLEHRKSSAPVHLELASMANADFLRELYQSVIVFVDSIGLNDQELMFLIKCIGGPEFQANGAIDKTVEAMIWVLNNVRQQVKSERYLSRIHMHSHRFHVVATSKRSVWSGLAEGLLHGAYVAAVHACGSEEPTRFNLSKAKFSNGTVLPHYEDRSPVITWFDSDDSVEVFIVPTILCRKPIGTVGLGDAISAASLVYTGMVMGN